MRRPVLFDMKPLPQPRPEHLEEVEVSKDFSECGFHCPPDCPILRAGKCPDTD